jgi:DNA-directed RNA polymerase subunit beta'
VLETVKAGNKVLVKEGEAIDDKAARAIDENKIESVKVRSILQCNMQKGVCRKCYGFDLSKNKPVEFGVAVGIIAAQSIGEPGTQLTMRTFHTGGVAGGGDITQGLPRVDELFEARTPKKQAMLAEVSGEIEIEKADGKIITSPSGKKILKAAAVKKLSIFISLAWMKLKLKPNQKMKSWLKTVILYKKTR